MLHPVGGRRTVAAQRATWRDSSDREDGGFFTLAVFYVSQIPKRITGRRSMCRFIKYARCM